MLLHTEAGGPLQDFRLSEELRQILAPFVWSLSIVIGNDSKAAKEAQTMHSMQLSLGKADMHGPSMQSDTVTFSMVLQNMVDRHDNASVQPLSIFFVRFQPSLRTSAPQYIGTQLRPW
jgi:hypothetical protein